MNHLKLKVFLICVCLPVVAFGSFLTMLSQTTPDADYNLVYSDTGREIKLYMDRWNISSVQSQTALFIPLVEGDYKSERSGGREVVNTIRCSSEEFIANLAEDNVSAVLTDQLWFLTPKNLELNTYYVLTSYHIWYFVDLPNVGTVAKVFSGQYGAFAY